VAGVVNVSVAIISPYEFLKLMLQPARKVRQGKGGPQASASV
jgi:hypothetical protein